MPTKMVMMLGWLRRLSESVAHLQPQSGRCEKIDAGAVYACGVEVVAGAQFERAELHSVVFAFGDQYAARHHLAGYGLPIKFHLRAYDGFESVLVVGRQHGV